MPGQYRRLPEVPVDRRNVVREHPRQTRNGSAPTALKLAAGAVSEGIEPSRQTLAFGDARFQILRKLGEGGMGRVYEAYDRQRKCRVALKSLVRRDADGVYLLKNEFRSLADLVHHNIVRLHELFGDERQWFFTMELVDGVRFDEWLGTPPSEAAAGASTGSAKLNGARLRAAFAQLAEGIAAIHAAGKLHRDLKPSNVLVTAEGRVVVLDFGLATEPASRSHVAATGDFSIVGTPTYLAPEQAAGAPATSASDCYAIGVMLFEALTGRLPFLGHAHEVLLRKQLRAAPSLRLARIPSDLALLCDSLLVRDPSARATLDDVRAILRSSLTRTLREDTAYSKADRDLLVGREHELSELRRAFEAARVGRPTVVFVSGESGSGKTALCSTFLDELPSRGEVIVLEGRCYEGENVPYKGIDSLVDGVTQFIRTRSAPEIAALLPKQLNALARVFPVLGRIDAITYAARSENVDPVDLRDRAFTEFTALLASLRRLRPLICWIDDAQRLDRDAIALLEHFLSAHATIPILLILSHRSERFDCPSNLSRLRSILSNHQRWCLADVSVTPLSPSAARLLATELLSENRRDLAGTVASEASGNPFFVRALARHMNRCDTKAPAVLKGALLAQVDQLEPSARTLLECVAVAGSPLPIADALEATGSTHVDLDLLKAERLLRRHELGLELTIECYHDKIREIVSQLLTPVRAIALHEALFAVIEKRSNADPRLLALHARGMGNHAKAATYAVLAAKRASASLAFDQAALFYEQALSSNTLGRAAERQLWIDLAESLANAGRGEEAAAAFVEAARASSRDVGLELSARAGKLLLNHGHIADGKQLLRTVLRTLNSRLPENPVSARILFVWERLRLRLRGLAFRPKRKDLSSSRKRELDILWSTVHGLQGVDLIGAACLNTRYIRLALDSGIAEHGARAFACEAYMTAGDRSLESRNEMLLSRAETLAMQSGAIETIAFVDVARGVSAYAYGDQRRCRMLCEHAIQTLLKNCTGAAYELNRARQFSLLAAGELGDVVSPQEVTALIDDGWKRGDISGAIAFTGLTVLVRLFQHADEDVRRHVAEARKRWRAPRYFTWIDWFLLIAELYLEVYTGQFRRGLDRLLAAWPAMETAGFTRSPVRPALYFYRGAIALAVSREGGRDAVQLRSMAQESAQKLLSAKAPFAEAYGQTLAGWIEHDFGHTDEAIARFRNAVRAFEISGMLVYAAVVRAKLASLVKADEGAVLEGETEHFAAMRTTDMETAMRLLMLGLS
jgi:serine/threonine protein kinase